MLSLELLLTLLFGACRFYLLALGLALGDDLWVLTDGAVHPSSRLEGTRASIDRPMGRGRLTFVLGLYGPRRNHSKP